MPFAENGQTTPQVMAEAAKAKPEAKAAVAKKPRLEPWSIGISEKQWSMWGFPARHGGTPIASNSWMAYEGKSHLEMDDD